MKIRLFDASFLHGEVELTCFLVCDCVFEITCTRWEQMKETGPEWGVTNTNRQNNYPFPHGAVSVSVTATLSQWSSWIAVTLSKGREGSAWSAVMAPWADDAGCLPDFPLCWLVNYVTGSGIRHLRGWHARINERLLGACVFMWEVCVLNSWPIIWSNLSLIPLF